MIQEIINKGSYRFSGTVDDLKKCIGSFRITKVIRSGNIMGVEMFDADGKFRYHGIIHKVYISKLWNENTIIIEHRGEINGERCN